MTGTFLVTGGSELGRGAGWVCVGFGAVAGVGALQKSDFAVGLGLGLAVRGLLMFALDWAVLDRAQAYAVALGLR